MTLRDLFGAGQPAVPVTALAFDNRVVEPGTVFFCVVGMTRDGHDFAPDAVARGAAALVVQRPLELDVPQVLVPDVRAAMPAAAARLAGDPTDRLTTVGITGTNGKTTSAYLLRGLLEGAGHATGLLGTVASVIGGVTEPTVRTTPEAIELQRTFAAMLEAGDTHCVMEVSSHALSLGRADAIHWAAAVFTNLTQDHLDFHPTMEDYFQAKRELFVRCAAQGGLLVANVDDPYGRRLAQEFPGAVTVGLGEGAALRATGVVSELTGSTFVVDGHALRCPLPGSFNVVNALGAIAVARGLGVGWEAIARALPRATRAPGRFEPVDEGQDFAVLVDYSHTPDSVESVLRAARGLTGPGGRVLVTLGAGGDRDRGKRPLMGAAASAHADVVVLTSDNPRSEDPLEILAEVAAGADADAAVEPDRRRAIAAVVEAAQAGDVVVIAGKGHEQGQEHAGGRKEPFDDATEARRALRRLGAGAP